MQEVTIISINKSRLLSLLKQNNDLLNDITTSNTFVNQQLNTTINDSNDLLRQQLIKDTIPFILWNDTWNEYGVYGSKRNSPARKYSNYRYSRGRKIFVEFGCGNIGREISLPHPAFVVYNFPKTAVIVPTTSDDGSPFSKKIKKALIRCPSDGQVFPKDSLINLHQITMISKNRILNDLNCSASQYNLPDSSVDEINKNIGKDLIEYGIDLKECIELKLAHLYAPDIFFKLFQYKEEVEKLKNKNNQLQNTIEQLKNG